MSRKSASKVFTARLRVQRVRQPLPWGRLLFLGALGILGDGPTALGKSTEVEPIQPSRVSIVRRDTGQEVWFDDHPLASQARIQIAGVKAQLKLMSVAAFCAEFGIDPPR